MGLVHCSIDARGHNKIIWDFQTHSEEHVLNQDSKEVRTKNLNNIAKRV